MSDRIAMLDRTIEARASNSEAAPELMEYDQRLSALEERAETAPIPIQLSPSEPAMQAEMSDNREDQRRCLALLRELHQNTPVNYLEFRDVKITEMDDLDRVLWRETLFDNPNNIEEFLAHDEDPFGDRPAKRACRDFFSISLAPDNADKRNESYRLECYDNLLYEEEIERNEWQSYVEAERGVHPDAVNQFTRILNWLNMPGAELLAMDNPPYQFLRESVELSWANQSRNMPPPSASSYWVTGDPPYEPIARQEEIIAIWRMQSSEVQAAIEKCARYYPQVFYGRWMPFEQPDTYSESDVELPSRASERNRCIYLDEAKCE